MSVKLLTEHHLECLSLKRGCTVSSESTLVKMSHCWKSHVAIDKLITLEFVTRGSKVKGGFQFAEERSRAVLFAQYVNDFCACTLSRHMPTKCSYAKSSFTERNANSLSVSSFLIMNAV